MLYHQFSLVGRETVALTKRRELWQVYIGWLMPG